MLIFSNQRLSKSKPSPPKSQTTILNFDQIFPNFAEHFLEISVYILVFSLFIFAFHFGSIAQARELNWRTQNPTFPNQTSN
jgi:hypothetical protein